MDASHEVSSASDLTRSSSPEDTHEPTDEPDHRPDPSAAFLERKARMRAAAARQPRRYGMDDQPGEYRGNTTSGAWLPLMHGRGK
jgi:hypothetical protein